MLATFLIEIILAIVVIVRMPKTNTVILGASIITLLSLFQLAEYAICEELVMSAEWWGRIGFAAITLLPPLGFHLAKVLAGKPSSALVYAAYLSGAAWIGMFLSGSVIDSYQCTSNYLIFHMSGDFGGTYFTYYYIWLLAAMAVTLRSYARRIGKYMSSLWLLIGYSAFVFPATIIWLIDTRAADGLPSIMCGFAVVLAIILALRVLPLSNTSGAGKKK